MLSDPIFSFLLYSAYFGALSMLQRGMLQLSEELESDCNAVMNAHNKQREAQNGQQPQAWN